MLSHWRNGCSWWVRRACQLGKLTGEAKAVFGIDVLRGDSLQVWHGAQFPSG
jgi:hypothetical protein